MKFIRDLVAQIKKAGSIDASKVYATGLSNGGSMSHTLACEAADVFTATAPVSFTLSGGSNVNAIKRNCTPSEPIPVIHFHGKSDELVNYNRGILDAIGAEDSLKAWVDIQKCSASAQTTTLLPCTTCKTHTCAGGVEVAMCAVDGGAHVLHPLQALLLPGPASLNPNF